MDRSFLILQPAIILFVCVGKSTWLTIEVKNWNIHSTVDHNITVRKPNQLLLVWKDSQEEVSSLLKERGSIAYICKVASEQTPRLLEVQIFNHNAQNKYGINQTQHIDTNISYQAGW